MSTVHGWIRRGYLSAADIDPQGHRLYKMVDVLRAERDVRRRAVGRNRIS